MRDIRALLIRALFVYIAIQIKNSDWRECNKATQTLIKLRKKQGLPEMDLKMLYTHAVDVTFPEEQS